MALIKWVGFNVAEADSFYHFKNLLVGASSEKCPACTSRLIVQFYLLGSVYVTIEISGPVAQAPPVMFESPEALFHLGTFLCDTCVGKERTGGFATHGFGNAARWVQENSPPLAWRSLPAAGATFFTITVSGPSNKRYSPGNTDPAVALGFGQYIATEKVDPNDRLGQLQRKSKEIYWDEKASEMIRGEVTNWWSLEPPGVKDEMVYQCDSSLGRPSANDCATINWQQLAMQSDALKMGPETVFFHVNTCYLAISATVAIVLNWDQIRLAASALMNTCVQNPFQAAQGGRAYFGSPTYRGSTQRSKRQIANLTGWNALPPHVSITIFEQTQPWINPVEELETCTWKAAVNRRPVASCLSR